MSKYKTLDEIIDAYQGRPKPEPIKRRDGSWVPTDNGAHIWVWNKPPSEVEDTVEENLMPGISKPNTEQDSDTLDVINYCFPTLDTEEDT